MQKNTGTQSCFLDRLYLKMQSKIYDFLPSPSYFCTSGLTDHHHHRFFGGMRPLSLFHSFSLGRTDGAFAISSLLP